MHKSEQEIIYNVPIFNNIKRIDKINGGITNQNFMVKNHDNQNYFVRICKDIPEHLISRENEINSSTAAYKIGVSPKIIYTNNKLIIFEFIKGKTLNEKEVKENLIEIIKLLKKVHTNIPKKIEGLPQIFWVFHVIRHYKNFLEKNNSKYKKIINELIDKSEKLRNIHRHLILYMVIMIY